MSRHDVREMRPGGPEVAETPRHGGVGIPESPYLTLEEGALFCRFDTRVASPVARREQFRRWLHRTNIPVRRVGRAVLVERRVLEAFLRGEAWTRAGEPGRPRLVKARAAR